MMIDDERPFRVGAKTDPRSLKIKRPQVGNHCVIKVTPYALTISSADNVFTSSIEYSLSI